MPRVVIDPAVPDRGSLNVELARLRGLDVGELRARWHTVFRRRAPPHLPRHLLFRILAYRLQADRLGDLDADSRRLLDLGGIPFTRGPLAHLLRNRFYIGEVAFKGDILPGEQPAVLDRDLFDAVQAKLNEQRTNHTAARDRSEALLIGRLYDDGGNRMTPSHVRKDGIKYRYYLSSPLLHGQPGRAGSMHRVPAAEVEARVASALREHFKDSAESDDRDLIRSHVVRVELHMDQLAIEFKAAKTSGNPRNAVDDRLVLRIPWKKTPMKRRREIIIPASASAHELRPIRAETRATLVAAIARGRRWLDDIIAGTVTGVDQIAAREQCSIRQVQMTISLAFLAPSLVKAAIEGKLPRGIGVTRLRDAPAEWTRQYVMLGLSI